MLRVSIFLLALACGSQACSGGLMLGSRETGDELLWQGRIDTDYVFLNTVHTSAQYTGNNWTNITCVKVIDHGAYSCPSLSIGGPGCNNVTLDITSKWNSNIDSTVQVYGYEILI